MIPILYQREETEFQTNGIGRLADCISCIVTEERNGIFECEFEYPITGVHYDDIQEGRIISVTHDEQGDRQPFIIYRRSAPLDGIVTFNAHHVSYELGHVILSPFSATSITDAFAGFEANTYNECPFTFWTDKTSSGTFNVEEPISIKAILGGMQGSILDAFGGGEYEWDLYTVKLYQHRGTDSGVTIRYGKNLTKITHEIDESATYNAVVPYWVGEDGTVIDGGIVVGSAIPSILANLTNEQRVNLTTDLGRVLQATYYDYVPVPMDLSEEFEEQPTASDLAARAQQIIDNNQPWIPKENIKVDFVALWQTEEYADVAPLQRVRLCDTVSVYYPELGVDAKSKVIRTDYNVLLDKYDTIELGDAVSSFADTITAETEEIMKDRPTTSMMDRAISRATSLITGGMGGHVLFRYDADGKPTEILIMDTEDAATAIHVLRINVNGIGFSSRGINGPYASAWTLDGQFVADFITAGTMTANRIQGGTLTLGGYNNGNGVLRVVDADNNEIGRWDYQGIKGTAIRISGTRASYIEFPFNPAGWVRLNALGFGYKNSSGRVINASTYYDLPDDATDYPAQGTTGWELDDLTGTYQTRVMAGIIDIEGPDIAQGYITSSSIRLGNRSNSFYCIPGRNPFCYVIGNFAVAGTKNRIVETEDYSERLLYSYETPSPMFGDVGEGELAEDGACYIALDPIFAQTITTANYQVFLQRYGEGECYVSERHESYFIVKGTAGLAFGWEIKAKQSDFDQLRLEAVNDFSLDSHDYGSGAAAHIAELNEGRISA